MRIAIPDLVSPSYFPAIAAVELGFAAEEGLDVELELLFPVTDAAEALRDRRIDFLGGAAHAALHAFPEWEGAKLLAALSHNMYWFLVVRPDLAGERGDLSRLRDVRIGAAPGPDLGLEWLLRDAGIDASERGIHLQPVAGTDSSSVSFGVTAAESLAEGKVDGFWANGMGAEVAVRRGVGTVILDARRGDGPAEATSYTFPALLAAQATIDERPDEVAAMVRAVVRAQRELRESPEKATPVGERLFPPMEATLIAELVRRDAPFYDPAISPEVVAGVNRFAQRAGLLEGDVPYDSVVAGQFMDLWRV